jgi:hypothetical protein
VNENARDSIWVSPDCGEERKGMLDIAVVDAGYLLGF